MNDDYEILPVCPLCNLPVLPGEQSLPVMPDGYCPPATRGHFICLLKAAAEQSQIEP